MASPRSAWGIDIGNRALKAVKLVRTGDGIRVDDFEFIEHETVLSQSGDNRDDLVKQALATFVGRKNTKGSAVSIGVSGQQSFAHFIKLPPVEDKQLPSIVKFEALQQIPFPLDEVEWSYQLFSTPDSPDKEVGIFAMRKELVNAHVKLFTDQNLNVQVVQMNPLALFNAVQHDGRLDGPAMIVDVGAENTDLIIASNESIWLRSIPIGGNNFTEVIAKAFKLSQEKAEDMKRNISSSKYQKQIFQAMRPVFADLVAEIQRSIGFYGSVNRENKITKIIALGGTFQLSSLAKYLNQNLQLEVERPNAPVAQLPNDSKVAAEFTENILALYSAYGLALQGIGEARVTSSLLPAAIRREKAWKEKNMWFGVAAGLFGLGTLLVGGRYLMDSMAINGTADKFQQSQAVVSGVAGPVNNWKLQIQTKGKTEADKTKNVLALNDGKMLWPVLVEKIFDAVPKPSPELADAIAKGEGKKVHEIDRNKRDLFQVTALRSYYVGDFTPYPGADPTTGTLNNTKLADFASAILVDNNKITSPLPAGTLSQVGQSLPTGVPTVDPAAPPPPGGPKRGFLIYVAMVTPKDPADSTETGGNYTDDVLKKAFMAVKSDAGGGSPSFKVVAVEATGVRLRASTKGAAKDYVDQLRNDYTDYLAALQKDVTPSTPSLPNNGMPMTPPGREFQGAAASETSGPLSTDSAVPFVDPLTGEDMRDDFLIEVYLQVLIDPPPDAAAPAPAAAPDAGTPPAAPPAPQ